MAGIAEKYGAGNCDMAGSMAYTMMRAALNNSFEIMLILNTAYGHTYSAFKEAGAADATAIIVDPWPTSGMATLAEHHFQGFAGNPTIIRKRGKWVGAGEARDRVALNAKYAALTALIDDDLANVNALPPASYTPYTNTLCSTQVGGYQDQHGIAIATPAQRLPLDPPPIPMPDVIMADA
ncbi:hypothetical protein F2P44_27570 [Massilia sp. CCM 8695]|uniref:Thiamine pyrophosphate enzyme TPP-binding domain-containing protein n=1 Tax=Massilia frigida TaxID=2609281 RepID=A0ABX0NF58_9BURK|nr:hypothetical protein [Massilia frigida]NHZ83008.1 hypothetical protein [Massilia frigida]